jgi:tyrosine-protein phosphatase YwqE
VEQKRGREEERESEVNANRTINKDWRQTNDLIGADYDVQLTDSQILKQRSFGRRVRRQEIQSTQSDERCGFVCDDLSTPEVVFEAKDKRRTDVKPRTMTNLSENSRRTERERR